MGNLHNKSNLFVYGEVLQDGNVDNIGAYESFMNVIASNFGGAVRNVVTSTNLSSLGTNLDGVDSNKAVNFVENHDTYEDGSTRSLTNTQRELGWAIVAARASLPLYFLTDLLVI